MSLEQQLEALYGQQLEHWPMCARNYAALDAMEMRVLKMPEGECLLQFNPARIKSVSAKVTDGKVDRACFLCREALPPEQMGITCVVPDTKHVYRILLNPYPLTRYHWTIVADEHVAQNLQGRERDMEYFAHLLPHYLVFFNGACSGASAPDHFHFQAVPQAAVPLLRWNRETHVRLGVGHEAPALDNYDYSNVVCWADPEGASDAQSPVSWGVFRRKAHRPWQYGAEGDEKVLISPAALECCGLVPLARKEDYDKMSAPLLGDIMRQVLYREPLVKVGIIDAPRIEFMVNGCRHRVDYQAEGKLLIDNELLQTEVWTDSSTFSLFDVVIGKEFHWQKTEDQVFAGKLHIIAQEGCLHAINYVPVETYLRCVIASEMSDRNNLTLLKTHAIISRSWVLRQMADKETERKDNCTNYAEHPEDSYIYWYDHDNHTLFDVCADDHCQRYQGLGRVHSPLVDKAIAETRGVVLLDDDSNICDARFSKCCGGVTEQFSACWQDKDFHYLASVVDVPVEASETCGDLTTEEGARCFIEQTPPAFCNTSDGDVLRLVLNNYDQTTVDFYRWKVSYTQSQLSALIEQKLAMGFGKVLHLYPLKRGRSGRIIEMQVVGTRRTAVIGKELVIRKALSESHLYSSAFVVDEEVAPNGETIFHLKGAGWGHGVGLCQIGAACMSLKGYTYEQILNHYFKGAHLQSIY